MLHYAKTILYPTLQSPKGVELYSTANYTLKNTFKNDIDQNSLDSPDSVFGQRTPCIPGGSFCTIGFDNVDLDNGNLVYLLTASLSPRVYVLVLQHTGDEKRQYRRVGRFNCSKDDASSCSFIKLFKDFERQAEEIEYRIVRFFNLSLLFLLKTITRADAMRLSITPFSLE